MLSIGYTLLIIIDFLEEKTPILKTREILTDIQRTFFYEIPSQMDERELIRYYILSDEELQIVNQQRGDHNRLGFAIQISYLRFPGRPLLAKAVFFNQLGEIRDRSYEAQLHRASGLQLIISAIVTWNSIYISRAIETLRNNGIHIPEEYIQHISPLGWEHITLTGDYIWNLNQELNFENLRSLR
ncbi:Tn3 family transposase [Bacillus toyonensis]|uniref:Tn3 family transposase n=1 Tax=Bacillus toyonensis TaxID=155322 RepID=UPI0026B4E2F0